MNKDQLIGEFEKITMMELRHHIGEIFLQVGLGKVYLLTRVGKPVAVLSKPPGETLITIIESDGTLNYSPFGTPNTQTEQE
jgi:hypothetical protein